MSLRSQAASKMLKKHSDDPKKFIQRAIKKPGAFREWCQRRGFEGANKACIALGKKSRDATTRRRARFAETLATLRDRRK